MTGEDIENLFNKLVAIVETSTEKQVKLKKLFEETLMYNLATSVVSSLNEADQASLNSFMQSHNPNSETIILWFREHLTTNKDRYDEQIAMVILQTIEDFFKAITRNISDQKRDELLSVIKTQEQSVSV